MKQKHSVLVKWPDARAGATDGTALPTMAPYLVRAVFDGFPGQNGQVRRVNFDRETGAVIRK